MAKTSSKHTTDENANKTRHRSLIDVILRRRKRRASEATLQGSINIKPIAIKGQEPEAQTWPKSRGRGQPNTFEIVNSKPQAQEVNVDDLCSSLEICLASMDLSSDNRDRYRMGDFLDRPDVYAMFAKDKEDRTSRNHFRANLQHLKHVCFPQVPNVSQTIMREPLHNVLTYASSWVSIHGTMYEIPIVVRSCVESLLQRGMDDPTIFRKLPNQRRYMEIVDIFDAGPSFGSRYTLAEDDVPDTAAVLMFFLGNLQGPIIPLTFFHPLWDWCTRPSVRRENAARRRQTLAEQDDSRGDSQKPVRWTIHEHAVNEEWEKMQVAAAVCVLKLLPAANLALLTYLFDFFTSVCHCSRNPIRPRDITRIFGDIFVGGMPKPDSLKIVTWLLERWPLILSGLFGVQVNFLGEKTDLFGSTAEPSTLPDRRSISKEKLVSAKIESGLMPTTMPLRLIKKAARNDKDDKYLQPPSAPIRSPSSFSSASCYSNDDEEEIASSESSPPNQPSPHSIRPDFKRLPTGISETDEIVLSPMEGFSSSNLTHLINRASSMKYRLNNEDKAMFSARDNQKARDKTKRHTAAPNLAPMACQQYIDQECARSFAIERQVSIQLSAQATSEKRRNERIARGARTHL